MKPAHSAIKRGEQSRKKKEEPQWEPVTLGNLLSQSFPPPVHLLSGLLNHPGALLLWGATGSGKSLTAFTLALAIASGNASAFGWPTKKPAKVLYIDAEMGKAVCQRRLHALTEGGRYDKAQAEENFLLLTSEDLARMPLDLSEEGALVRLFALLDKKKVEVLILDNLSFLSDGMASEVDAEAMKPIARFIKTVRDGGRSVFLLHHSGKNDKSARGSTHLEAPFDVCLHVMKTGGGLGGGDTWQFEVTKNRHAPQQGRLPGAWEIQSKGDALAWAETGAAEPKGWKEFRDGTFTTLEEFCKLAMGHTNGSPFKRYYLEKWRGVGISEEEIDAAMERMKERSRAKKRR